MSKAITEQEFLKHYNVHDYDVPLLSVDMTIFTVREDKLYVLLVKRAQFPAKGQWALPGGFVDLSQDEQLMDTAKRKLKEKTGVDTPYLEQVETIGNQKRDPRGWSVTVVYFALIAHESIKLKEGNGTEEVKWVELDKVDHNLAFDHKSIVDSCYERLRSKVQYTSLPINLLPENFTLAELQTIFEIILGKSVEKKSFRRRILDANILVETGEMKAGNTRPAKLYRVISEGENHYFSRNLEGVRQ